MRKVVMSDGAWQTQGWPRQEGQAQERDVVGQEVTTSDTPIYDELMKGHPALMAVPCTICSKPESEHVPGNPDVHHAFAAPGAPIDTSQFARKRPEARAGGDDARRHVQTPQHASQGPFDPVLRQALVDAGVITPEQLEAAARKISMMTSSVIGTTPASQYRGG
jgi:hypothetical protein